MKHTVINTFGSYIDWLDSFEGWNEEQWVTPISETKWPAREIVTHIMFWDRYLLDVSIGQAASGKDLTFPDFDPFNQKAAEYAQSGLSKSDLLLEAKETRTKVIEKLLELPEEVLTRHLKSNGASHCPHTGEPYSLLYIIVDFSWHDQHHQKQIKEIALR